ncbi:hypothetical protein GGH94_003740 [Coemansia aciculifera]|uniref:MPN domain-containing protein n=1 Tax=Coemansia aciculifera TaxID=417176 RepID=A0A9W8IH76_9FUNG|nr:hypothetical protein GGH94_003740 [Coemansia aciculifera]KAJ2870787.1 hypothetical protein GGH93_005320 [Coemansia aciculifera]
MAADSNAAMPGAGAVVVPEAAVEQGSSTAHAQGSSSWKPGERVCSIAELSRASNIRLSRNMPIAKYFRDLDETLEKAKKRLLEQDLQYAYVFYLRYVTVVIKHLPGLPDYHKPEYAKHRERTSKAAKKALSTLEKLQPILQMRYDEYVKYLASLPRPIAQVSTFSTRRGSSVRRLGLSDSSDAPSAPSIDEYQKADPVPRLPSIHLRRESDAARHGFSLAETLSGLNLGDSSPVARPKASAPKEAILIEYPPVEPSPASRPETQHQQYSPVTSEFSESAKIAKPPPPPVPPRPQKHAACNSISSVASQPASPSPCLPPKPQGYHSEADLYKDGANTTSGDDGLLFMPQCIIDAGHFSLTEGGVRMRPVQLPEGIVEEFIDIAAHNTQANIETCGVLCGRQVAGQEALVMTTLIIPKQSATSDTCTTEREEELFVEQMARDLITLGWIHTHPSQTCFMSSLDLHTQCSYQLMLPEAIAIVCSPKHHPRFGIFRLTDPAGIDVIQNCKQKSAFHPHDESKTIYTDADTGGHVVVANYDFDIIDLRSAPVQ